MKTNKGMFKIGEVEKGIELKESYSKRGGMWMMRFRVMEPGDSFEIVVENTDDPARAINNVRFSATRYRNRVDPTFKYCTRRITENTWRFWRL